MKIQYRADHVGSFLRPPKLLEAREACARGDLTQSRLQQIEDESILKVLQVQKDAGLSIFTDGEYRRTIYSGALYDALDGLVPDTTPQPANRSSAWHGPNSELVEEALEEVRPHQMVVGGRLRLKQRIAGHESAFLSQHSPGAWKITLTPPPVQMLYREGVTSQAYATRDALLAELIGFYSQEIRQLVEEGAAYIQLDSLAYAMLGDPRRREQMTAAGQDPEKSLLASIDEDNALIEGLDRSRVTVGLHMCRGNNRSHWMAEGGYEQTAEKALNLLNVDRFLMEYDTERAGGFEPLRFLPKTKAVALGLISTKTPELEDQTDLLRRIEAAAEYVPIENLALTPQCGFASIMHGNLLTWDDQRRKLELLVETAQKVWGTTE